MNTCKVEGGSGGASGSRAVAAAGSGGGRPSSWFRSLCGALLHTTRASPRPGAHQVAWERVAQRGEGLPPAQRFAEWPYSEGGMRRNMAGPQSGSQLLPLEQRGGDGAERLRPTLVTLSLATCGCCLTTSDGWWVHKWHTEHLMMGGIAIQGASTSKDSSNASGQCL